MASASRSRTRASPSDASARDVAQLSVLQLRGGYESTCGYCTGGRSHAFGARAERLTCVDYAAACDHGWRRSGGHLYRPENSVTCCPALTIRLDTARFVASKDQNRCVRRLMAYLRRDGEARAAEPGPPPPPPVLPSEQADADVLAVLREVVAAAAVAAGGGGPAAAAAVAAAAAAGGHGVVQRMRAAHASAAPLIAGGAPAFSTGVAHAVVAALRRSGALDVPTAAAVASSIAARTGESPAARAAGAAFAAAGATGFVNIAVRDDGTAGAGAGRHGGTDPARPFTAAAAVASDATAPASPPPPPPPPPPPVAVSTASPGVPPAPRSWCVVVAPSHVVDPASYALYARYQAAVHGDAPGECTVEQYRRFLCASPLVPQPYGGPPPTDAGRAGDGGRGDSGVTCLRPDDAALAATLRRCVDRERRAWAEGEGVAAGLPLVAPPGAATGMAAAAGATDGSASQYHGFQRGADHVFPDMPGGGGGAGTASGDTRSGRPDAGAGGGGAGSGGELSESRGGAADLIAHGYGSFHHRYYLDGVLIAVAVVDVLPHCLSSVYVFYEPGPLGRNLRLGHVTALREIQWVQDACRVSPRLRWYYMGFMVHSCAKMRYKGGYAPSELRCDVTGAWVPYLDAVPRLDAAPYCALVGEAASTATAPAGAPRPQPPRRTDDAAAAAAVAALLPDGVPLLLSRPRDGGDDEDDDDDEDGTAPRPSFVLCASDLRDSRRVVAAVAELGRRLGPALTERVVVRLG